MDMRARLLRHGLLLFLLGLLTGLAVPAMANPRAALAGHLEGLLNGMFLMLVGLAWSELKLSQRAQRIAPPILLVGTYVNWLATTASAVLGTSMGTPIAGKGFRASDAVEYGMFAVLGVVALSMLFVLSIFVRSTWRVRG